MDMCGTAWKRALRAAASLAALAVLIMPGCSGKERPVAGAKPNVIIITLDTTRADCLGCYGRDVVRTPGLDAFARDAVLFRDCFSTANSTNPSHTSIFTSLYVRDHGVTDNKHRLSEYPGFMPKLFREAGYLTAGFTSGGHLNTGSNINQGFSDFDCPPEYEDKVAADTTDDVIKWLESYTGKTGSGRVPFMLWVHYFDPHMKYSPPAPYDTMYCHESGERIDWGRILDLSAEYNRRYMAASNDPEHFRNMYRGEISYMDEHLGRLLARIKEAGLYDDSIIVIVADHGESLGEHEIYWDHRGLYDVSVRVPLLIKPVGQFSPGARDQLVSTLDIYPTVFELAGIAPKGPVTGKSLVGVLANPSYPDSRNEVHFQSATADFLGTRTREYTYIRRVQGSEGFDPALDYSGQAAVIELYDNMNDPAQLSNLAAAKPDVTAYFEQRTAAFLSEKTIAVTAEEITDKAHLEKLRSLGYIQ